jgi:transcription elongation factor GreA
MSADAANMITAEGLEELEAELATLEGEGRRAIAERIKTAREWGDLKENSEYHDAKNDQAHLETKIAKLRERISTAEIVEESDPRRGGHRADVADRQLARRLAIRGAVVGGLSGRARPARTTCR